MQKGKIISVNANPKKGERKYPLKNGAELIAGYGIKGDGHGGSWDRQVSLLAIESIEKMKKMGLDVGCGDFAENITTSSIDLSKLKVGDLLKIGKDVVLEIAQIGKICHNRCSIFYQAGDCIMPREGVFAKVLKGGNIKKGDQIIEVDKINYQ
jgi:MOSC domain-containing protein YiiM